MAQSVRQPPFYADKFRLIVYIDEGGNLQPVRSVADWRKRQAHILANMQSVMGELPEEGKRVPLDVQGHEEKQLPHFVRRKITFATEPNDRVPAYLLIPNDVLNDRDHKAPAMLCLHQTTQIGKEEPVGLGGNPSLM